MGRNFSIIAYEYPLFLLSAFALLCKWELKGKGKVANYLYKSVWIPISKLNINFRIHISLKIVRSWFQFGCYLLYTPEFQSPNYFKFFFWELFLISKIYLYYKCIRILKSKNKSYIFIEWMSKIWGEISEWLSSKSYIKLKQPILILLRSK